MRYAIFSDVHANRQAWEAVRADMLRQRVGTLVCLGDVVGYGPRPLEVLTSVREATPNFVLGNHDAAACGRLDASIFNLHARAVIDWTRQRLDGESLEFLNRVPLHMDGEGVEFVHAEVREPGEFGYVDGPGPAGESMRAMTQPLAFIGHTHLPVAYTMPEKGGQVEQLPAVDFRLRRGRRTLVNVGSVGEPRTTDVRASYVIYDDVERTVSFRQVAFDVDGYKADLEQVGLDILPYFVQVVDAGRVAGARAPIAGPQLAMAELPSVSEVVAGHHARLVPGAPDGVVATPLKHPGKLSKGLIVTLILLAAAVGGIAFLATRGGRENVAANGRKEAPAAPVAGRGRRVDTDGSLENLKAKLFARSIASLDRLREIEKTEFPLQEFEVTDGLLSLSCGQGLQTYGLVWQGDLRAPEPGVYQLTLDCDDGAALFLDGRRALEIDGQESKARAQTVEFEFGADPAGFRLEFYQAGGDANLELTWTGPHSGGDSQPVDPAPEDTMPAAASETVAEAARNNNPPPEAPATRPPPGTKPAETLSQDLLSYWSFDAGPTIGNRLERQPDGSLWETLVAAESQRVRVLVPQSDIGTGWRDPDFEDTDWTIGQNGVGYEDKPGDFKDLLRTTVAGAPNKRPHSICVRIPFRIEDPGAYAGLALYMNYDDGFVAFLNGQPMASRNAPEALRWNSASAAQNDDKNAVVPELFKANRGLRHLRTGRNVLAIHGLNASGKPNATNTGCTSSDMLILATLIALRNDDGQPQPVKQQKRSPSDMPVAKDQIKGDVELTGGRFGDGYRFKGGGIEIGQAAKYSIGENSFSVSLWFRTNQDRGDKESRHLISAGAGDAEAGGWALLLDRSSNTLTFELGDGKQRTSIGATANNLTNATWWHVAATVDRPSGMVRLYLNGAIIADQCVDFVGKGGIGSAAGLLIGRSSDDRRHYRGQLDEVAIWNRSLVPEEVNRIFKHGNDLGSISDP